MTGRVAAGASLGWIVLALGVEVLGWFGALRPLPLSLLLALAVFVPFLMGPAPNRGSDFSTTSRPPRIPFLLIGAAVATVVLRAANPPTGDDELIYHLPLVRDALEAGRWRPVPDLLWAGYPRSADHVFLVGYALAGESGARLGAAGLFGLSVIGVFAAARRIGGAGAAWWCAAAWATTDVVLGWAPAAYVDVALAAVAATALAAALAARDGEAPAWPAVAIAGFAASVKYTGVLVPLALLPVLGPRRGAAAILASALFLLPTAARNVAHGLDPLAPVIAPSAHPWLRANELAKIRDVDERWPVTAPVALAWDLATAGRTTRYQMQGMAMTPLLLLFLPAAALAGRAGAAAVLGWCLSTALLPQIGRFHLWAVALVLAAGAAAVRRGGGAATGFVGAVATLAALPTLWRSVASAAAAVSIVAGAASSEAYLESRLGDHYRAMRLVRGLSGRVLLVGDPRTYHAGRIHPCDYTSPLGAELHAETEPARVAARLREAGVRWIYINGLEVDPLATPVSAILLGRVPGIALAPVGRWGEQAVYRVEGAR